MALDFGIIATVWPFLLKGALTTVELVLSVIVISTPLSILVALARESRFSGLSFLFGAASAFMRGVPPLIILFAVFFMLPGLGINIDAFPAAVAGMSLYTIFYFAEAVRAGLVAVSDGQYEAMDALGIPRFAGFTRIILPQAVPAALPSYIGHATEVVKNSALASSISVAELMGNAQQMVSSTGRAFEILSVVAVLYAVIDIALLLLQAVAAKRFHGGNVGHAARGTGLGTR
jgi:His/Glu/Gln/Arg/opine family amino acid ABC transporter permease subunit